MRVRKNVLRLIFSLLISIMVLKSYYHKFNKNFRDGCSFVYLAYYIKRLRTGAF